MIEYTKRLYIYAITAGLLAFSCENVDFGETNVDPDLPITPVSSGLLTNAQWYIGEAVTKTVGDIYVQHISNITYTGESRYDSKNWDSDDLYVNPLLNLQTIINLNEDEETAEGQSVYGSNGNQLAVAKILKAFLFHHVTDRWGMMPYSEALQGLENTHPVFDNQEAIYKSLFDELDEAIALMDDGDGPTGDVIFNGEMDRWKQFANTLKLVMALRLSNVYPEPSGYAATEFKEAMAGAISSVSENLYYTFLSDDNNDNPWQDRFQTREDYALSDVFTDRLLADGDPRIAAYADYTRTSVQDEDPQYIGMPYGLTTSSYKASDVSLLNSNIIYDGTFPGIIFTYAQVAFSYAEAVELGWISGDASQYYEEAIRASFEQWEVEGADDYITSVSLSSDTKTAVQQIAEEKWKALYLQGYESWAEWRRTGYPELTPAAEPLNGTDIPVRHGYDLDFSGTNAENYEAAVQAQGQDDLNTRLWWDEAHPITGK
ncbi:SusD/RagB family nutrient-binding outer membrane lipoprotein [Sinomicrobium sp. M5D2P17]